MFYSTIERDQFKATYKWYFFFKDSVNKKKFLYLPMLCYVESVWSAMILNTFIFAENILVV